jgi:N-acetylglucosamine malate deacetylase 1
MPLTVLAVFAHPDDEVLACGAVLARYAREGHRVVTAILGEGLTSRADSREEALATDGMGERLDELREDVEQAGRELGVAETRCLDLPDNRFDTLARLDVVKLVEELKAEFDPDVVFTHHAGDVNVDHGVTAAAVMTAFRSLPDERPRTLLAGEVLSSTDYSIGWPGRAFEPTVWVPVSEEDVRRKVRALEAYGSEVRAFPHPRSAEAIEAAARVRGVQCGTEWAEAFRLLRSWGGLPGIGLGPNARNE